MSATPRALDAVPKRANRAHPGLLLSLLLASLLAGCAGVPMSSEHGGPLGVVNGDTNCYAPQPNLRAAYNRTYTVLGRTYTPLRSAEGYEADGTASWYGWESGSRTAMGTAFSPRAFTAASRILPLPSCVQVTNLNNGRSALVLVNDRGPFVDSRIMDLSYAAAKALGVASTGTAPVRIVAFQGDMAARRPAPAEDAPVTRARPEPLLAGATPTVTGGPPQDPSASQALFHPAVLPTAQAQAVQTPGITVQALAPLQPSDSTGESATPPPPGSAAAQPLTSGATQDELSGSEALHVQAQDRSTALPLQSYLQTGAFTVEQNAIDERSRLQTSGIGPVQIVPGLIHGQSYYRVQIGPLPAATPPAALEQKLQTLGFTSYSIVQD